MQVQNLTKSYKLKTEVVEALKGVSFDLPDKGMVFILGKSGCGKSTLLNVLSGMDNFDGGDVVFKGKSLKNFSPKELDGYRNACCGFIFQEYNLIPELSVRDNIALSLQLQGKKDVEKRIADALKRVDLEGYEDRKVTELSGGQKQRVTIARAIIKDPEIIFADEPSGALDSKTGESIFKLLKELSEDKLVIIVSHDRESAEKYADRIIELSDGEIIRDTGSEYKEMSQAQSYKAPPSKMPLKAALKIGCSNFKYHPIRLLATVILAMMAFSFLGLSLNPVVEDLSSIAYATMESHDVEYSGLYKYKTVYFDEIIYGTVVDTYSNETPMFFTEEERQAIARRSGCALPVVESGGGIENLDELPDQMIYVAPSALSSMTKEEADKLGYRIDGSLPSAENEIAITEYTARVICASGLGGKKYNDSELLKGETLEVDGKEYTITGIIDTRFDFERYANLSENNVALMAEFESALKYGAHNMLFVNELSKASSFEVYYASLHAGEKDYDYYFYGKDFNCVELYTGDAVTVSEGEGIYLNLRSYYIQNLIEPNIFETILKAHWDKHSDEYYNRAAEYGYNDSKEALYDDLTNDRKFFTGGFEPSEFYYNAFKEYGKIDLDITRVVKFRQFDTSREVKVKGFIDINDYSTLYVSKGLYDELYNEIGGTYPYLIVKNDVMGRSAYDYFSDYVSDSGVKYEIYNYVTNTVKDMGDKIETLKKVMTGLSIAFSIFAVVLLLNFMITSVGEKTSTIGILKSLGSSNGNLIKIFIIEGLIVGAAVFILSIAFHALLGFIFSMIFSKAIGSIYIAVFGVTPLISLILLSVIAAFSVIGCVFPILKLSRLKPMEYLNKAL